MAIPSWFVIAMGLSTVFIGLICIIFLCKILGAICALSEKNKESEAPISQPKPVQAAPAAPVAANRQEIIAAIGVAIAEECGVDVNGIRIVSIKKI